jgi:transcriptional regulator with XRE-family HTH domain
MLVSTMADVAHLVRSTRTERGWTQAELARRMGVARDWVVRCEQGNPRLEASRVLDALTVLGFDLTAAPSVRARSDDDPFAAVFEALP